MYSSGKPWHPPTSSEIKRHQLEAKIRGNVITVRNKIDDLKEKFDRFDVYKEKRKEQLPYLIEEINKLHDQILDYRIREQFLIRDIPIEEDRVYNILPKAIQEAEQEKAELIHKRDELAATYKKLKTLRDNYEQKIIDKFSYLTPYDQMEGRMKKRYEDEDKSIKEALNKYRDELENQRKNVHKQISTEVRQQEQVDNEYIEQEQAKAREARNKEIKELLDNILNDTQKEDDIEERVDEFIAKREEENTRSVRLDAIIDKRNQLIAQKQPIRKRAEEIANKKETNRIDNERLDKILAIRKKAKDDSIILDIRRKAEAFPNRNFTVNNQIARLEAIKEQRKEELARQARQQAEQEQQQRDYLERQELAQFLENQRQQQAAENLRRQQEEERQQREQQEARELAERQRQQRELVNQQAQQHVDANRVEVPTRRRRRGFRLGGIS